MSQPYYYFAASLPVLEFGQLPAKALQAFLEDCERLLIPRDFADILSSSGNDLSAAAEPANRIARDWQAFMRNLRNEAAWLKAGQKNADPSRFVRGERQTDPAMVDCLVQASRSSDPLSGERLLAQYCWQKIDDLCLGHFFDFDVIFAYAVKLNILERFSLIESTRGEKAFSQIQDEAAAVSREKVAAVKG